jgi:hypothetical protein
MRSIEVKVRLLPCVGSPCLCSALLWSRAIRARVELTRPHALAYLPCIHLFPICSSSRERIRITHAARARLALSAWTRLQDMVQQQRRRSPRWQTTWYPSYRPLLTHVHSRRARVAHHLTARSPCRYTDTAASGPTVLGLPLLAMPS